MNGHYSLATSRWLTFKSIQSKLRKSGNNIKGQSGSRLLMIPTRLTHMTFLRQYTIHLCSLIFLAYQSWLISFRTRIISQVMMLTVTEPLSNQVDVVLVSHGITASTLAISHMETLPYLKLCFIRVMATSMLFAHNVGVVIRILLLFQFNPAMLMMPQLFRMARIWMRRRRILQYLPTLGLNITVMTVQRMNWSGTHLRLLPLLCHHRGLFQ